MSKASELRERNKVRWAEQKAQWARVTADIECLACHLPRTPGDCDAEFHCAKCSAKYDRKAQRELLQKDSAQALVRDTYYHALALADWLETQGAHPKLAVFLCACPAAKEVSLILKDCWPLLRTRDGREKLRDAVNAPLIAYGAHGWCCADMSTTSCERFYEHWKQLKEGTLKVVNVDGELIVRRATQALPTMAIDIEAHTIKAPAGSLM